MQFDKDINGKYANIFLKLRAILLSYEEIIEESLILNIEAYELKEFPSKRP